MDTKQPEALRLAPCPFCGGGARRTTVGTNAWFGTGCDGDQSCPAHLRALTHKTQAEADAAWNRRTPPAASELRRQHAENDAARLEIESLQTRIQELGQQARECSDRKVVQLESALARHVRSGKDWAMRVEALERTITTLRAHIASRNAQVAAAEKAMRELDSANSIALQLDARIKELEGQLDAVGAGGVEPLRKRDCLHQIQEPEHFRGATKMVDDDSAVMSISLRQRADAWMRVCALLHELRPGWIDTSTGTAAQQALDAIRSMAAQK